jgi:hypothetical protein
MYWWQEPAKPKESKEVKPIPYPQQIVFDEASGVTSKVYYPATALTSKEYFAAIKAGKLQPESICK